MDDRQFDGLTRAIGQTTNRRQALRSLVAIAAGAAGLSVAGADAARRGYSGPGENPSSRWFVEVYGTSSDTPGQCRMTCTIRGGPPNEPSTFIITSLDRPVVERARVFLNSNGYGISQTSRTVPAQTHARCAVVANGLTYGSDAARIDC